MLHCSGQRQRLIQASPKSDCYEVMQPDMWSGNGSRHSVSFAGLEDSIWPVLGNRRGHKVGLYCLGRAAWAGSLWEKREPHLSQIQSKVLRTDGSNPSAPLTSPAQFKAFNSLSGGTLSVRKYKTRRRWPTIHDSLLHLLHPLIHHSFTSVI